MNKFNMFITAVCVLFLINEIIFSVTQNLTCELPQFLLDFGDYACKLKKLLHSLTVRNFVECTINKKLHDPLQSRTIRD